MKENEMDYKEMRNQYFVGRKRTDDDGKLLKSPVYSDMELAEIKRTRVNLKHAMFRAFKARERWLSLLNDLHPGTPVQLARAVHLARRERAAARAEVRSAELIYRMAWEIKPLSIHSNRLKAKASSFLPHTPGMPIRPVEEPDFRKLYAKSDVEATLKMAGAKPEKLAFTDLSEHLRSQR